MARLELSSEAYVEWEKTIDPQKFLDENIVSAVKTFFAGYDSGNDEKKKELINLMVETFSKAMNVECKLYIPSEKMSGSAGSYERFSKRLTIYTKNSDVSYAFSSNVLTTILHELRHAYQHQHMMYENTELGKHVKYYTEHYSQPSETNFIQEVGYKTNFIEVDAQRFAFAVAKKISEKIIENSQNENRFTKKILDVKYKRIIAEANSFEKEFEKNNQVVKNFQGMYDSFKSHFKSLIASFYTTKFDSKENEKLQAKLISDSVYQLFVSRDLNNINNISENDLAELYIELLSSVKPEDFVSKLDNPLTNFFQTAPSMFKSNPSLSKKYGNDLIIYNKYVEKLKESVEFGKIFLDRFNIEYNQNDNKDIYLKYSKYSFEYLTRLFRTKNPDEFDKMLVSNVSSLQTRDRDNFNRQKLIDMIEKVHSTKEIKNILIQNVDNGNGNAVISDFQLNKGLLNGFGSCYVTEKSFGFYSKFLAHNKIAFDENNFDDIIEKFNKYYPVFVAECINKPELSFEEENFIYNSAIYLSNNADLLKKFVTEIQKRYSKSQIKGCFENSENEIVKVLTERGINPETILEQKTSDGFEPINN